MEKIILILKLLNLYAHNMHNLTKGPTFFQDHDFLGEIYAQYDTDYDDCVERAIGLGQAINLHMITLEAAQTCAKLPHDDRFWDMLLKLENLLQDEIKQSYQMSSIGTQQLTGEIYNKSEQRIYKLKQRKG